MKALLLTDNLQDESILAHALRMAGLAVQSEQRLEPALAQWSEQPADFLLVALRTADPAALVREIRRVAFEPLVIITDGIDEDTHIVLVNAGADWVIERPYNVRKLIVYTQAILRRASGAARAGQPALQHEGVKLDPATRTVRVDGKSPHRLSQLEFRLLHTLMVHRGQVLPTETIVEHVWGYTGEGDRALVRGLINRLRAKVESEPHNPRYIRTVSKVGYIFGGDE